MKVLQVINSLSIGGAEKLLLDSIPLYIEKGIEMELLLLNEKKTPFFKELEKYNITIYSLGNSSIYNPKLIFKIIPFLKNYKIVHVHLFPAMYWVVFAKLFSKSKPYLFFTEHSTQNKRLNSYLFKFIDKKIYNSYFKIVCISDKIVNIFTKYIKNDKKLIKIKNGVNLKKIRNEKSILRSKINSSFSEKHTIVLQVSSFQNPKNQKTLIKSMLLLPKEVKLILVGDGVLKKECEELTKQLNLENRVFFLGVRTDVFRLLKTVDIVVLSSKYEGLSLSSIEGMASGKPFVASNVPGLSDIVDGAGVLFEEGNEKDLAQKIIKLLTDKDHYDEVVKKCQERAEEYDISIMVERHIRLYNSIK